MAEDVASDLEDKAMQSIQNEIEKKGKIELCISEQWDLKLPDAVPKGKGQRKNIQRNNFLNLIQTINPWIQCAQ